MKILEWWIALMQRRAAAVITIAVLFVSGTLYYSMTNFRINADFEQMISPELPFRKLEIDYQQALPKLTDTIVVVIDGSTPEQAVQARESLAARLRAEHQLFKDVHEPGGGPFFEKNGFLYLDTEELQDIADNLAAAQPLLALLLEDLSLHGFFSVLETAVSRTEEVELPEDTLGRVFDRMSEAFESVTNEHPYYLSWQELMLGEKGAAEQRRQFIILQPRFGQTGLTAGQAPIEAIRHTAEQLRLDKEQAATIRITGDVALSYENLMTVESSIGAATIASLLLVATTLTIGLGGSGRLVASTLITLISGLILTMGFAIGAIGSLNLVSVTFAVLFIGLGIDYGIQFCLRYREIIGAGSSSREALVPAARGVGGGLLLSCITTAIGFYSFTPTAYAGVSELGIISGTGMFISFFATITLLPALLALMPLKEQRIREKRFFSWWLRQKLLDLPYAYTRTIVLMAAVIGMGAGALLPKLSFDYNPLNLFNPASESVVTAKELSKDPERPPWTASILVKGAEESQMIADGLARLGEVETAITLFDFIPGNQPEKLGIIDDMALFMPPLSGEARIRQRSSAENLKALTSFERQLEQLSLSSTPSFAASTRRLLARIEQFKAFMKSAPLEEQAFAALSERMLSALPFLLTRLERALQADEVALNDLPQELVDRYVTVDGRYRVQVFPREDIMDVRALERFVAAVRTVAPDATGSPVTILESGRTVVASFRQASLYALIAITAFLLIKLGSVTTTMLILTPLVLALLMTAAASVILGVPLNFANVIVVPLLLGIGVDNGIHFIHRYRTAPPSDGNMLRTSTARALLFSSLTTIMSFGSLSFLPHRGMASMGILLTLCMTFIIICTLVVLPALIQLLWRSTRTQITHSRDG